MGQVRSCGCVPTGARCPAVRPVVHRVVGCDVAGVRLRVVGRQCVRPLFALLYSLVLAAALRALWRSGERQEEIRVVPAYVEVIPVPGGSPVFRAHPTGCACSPTMRGSGWHPAAGRWRWGVSSRRPNVRRSQRHLKACSPPAMAATDDAKGLGNEAKQQVGHEVRERGCRSAGDRGLMPALAWAQAADPKPWQLNMGKG